MITGHRVKITALRVGEILTIPRHQIKNNKIYSVEWDHKLLSWNHKLFCINIDKNNIYIKRIE